MKSKKYRNKYIIRLVKGEEVISTLLKFLEKNKIKSGFFTGLGALNKVELAHYNLSKKEYSSKEINEEFEITSLIGNISTFENKPYIHSHITVGNNKMRLTGGHFKSGIVAATCEVVLTDFEELEIKRYKDEEIGLNLLNL